MVVIVEFEVNSIAVKPGSEKKELGKYESWRKKFCPVTLLCGC